MLRKQKKQFMKSLQKIIAFTFGLFLFAACSPKVPFTQAIRDQYKLTPDDLKHIQFYISDPVYLRRGASEANEKTTDQGTLVVKSGNTVEQVVVKRNTPGAVDQVVDADKLTVAFDEGADKFLVFGSKGDQSGYYHLLAISWEKGRGKVNYGGQTYYSNAGSDQSILLFKMKSLKEFKVTEKVARGKVIK
jgi:hypothetical protein